MLLIWNRAACNLGVIWPPMKQYSGHSTSCPLYFEIFYSGGNTKYSWPCLSSGACYVCSFLAVYSSNLCSFFVCIGRSILSWSLMKIPLLLSDALPTWSLSSLLPHSVLHMIATWPSHILKSVISSHRDPLALFGFLPPQHPGNSLNTASHIGQVFSSWLSFNSFHGSPVMPGFQYFNIIGCC